jgi:hypothetical protein
MLFSHPFADFEQDGDIYFQEEAYGWIARGFWVRERKLLALVTRFVGPKSC